MFLNYTCSRYIEQIRKVFSSFNVDDLNEYLNIIYSERNKIHKKHKINRLTLSDQAYDLCLGELCTLLKQGAGIDEIHRLCDGVHAISRNKIHMVFFANEPSCWASMESVYLAALNDPNVEAKLVVLPFTHQNLMEEVDYLQYYRDLGYDALCYKDYNIREDSPDLALLIKPYGSVPEGYQPKDLTEYIPRIIYIPYGMEATTDLIKYAFQYYLQYKSWRHCAYGDVVKEFGKRYGYRNGENIVVWGHPKADYVLRTENNKQQIPDEWKKIRGRKTILWTPHHLVNENEEGTGTFLVWGASILEKMEEENELAFIIRPHPMLMGNLINSGKYTTDMVENLRNRINNSENIIWDDNEQYYYSFCASDAIITDGTTFCIEYLYTKRPILLTPRNMSGFYSYDDMLKSYYIANGFDDIDSFITMIKNGKDPLKKKRNDFYKKLFYIPEGITVGENILMNAKRDLDEEIDNFALRIQERIIPGQKSEFPLFSVLVLCYKNTKLLYSMLDSILEQNYPNIELIVSDDCSEDFNVNEVTEYISTHKSNNISNFCVLKNDKNLGTVKHISEAYKKVNGEYFVFTAADDRFSSMTAISDYAQLFCERNEKEWIVARCVFTSEDYKKELYKYPTDDDRPFFLSENSQQLFSRWSRRGMAIPCSMAFRKRIIDKIGGFDLAYKYLEDWPLVLKLLRNGYSPAFIEKPTAIHSTGGVSNSNSRYGIDVRKAFYKDKYRIFKKEVRPYDRLLNKEDKKCLKLYMKEIMRRQYFFNIDLPGTGKIHRIGMCLISPIRGWWLFERFFMNHIYNRRMWKVFAVSGICLLTSTYFFIVSTVISSNRVASLLFNAIGYGCFGSFVLLVICGFLGFFLKRYFKAKYWLRKSLVN